LEGFLRCQLFEVDLLRVAILFDDLRRASIGCVYLRRTVICGLYFTYIGMWGHGGAMPAWRVGVMALPQYDPKNVRKKEHFRDRHEIAYHWSPWRPTRTNPREVVTRAAFQMI
jgi:hypothetical protein